MRFATCSISNSAARRVNAVRIRRRQEMASGAKAPAVSVALEPRLYFRKAATAGFTLAEVLAALLFMAIVIPVVMQGLRIASLAGEVAERKAAASRVARRILDESIVMTNWNQSVQNGTVEESGRPFRWTLRNEPWSQDTMQLLTVDVAYAAQDKECSVRMSTLVGSQQ